MEARSFPPESQRLEALRRHVILETGPERDFDDLAELTARLCDASMAYLAFVGQDRLWFKARHGLTVETAGREGSYCDFLLRQAGVHCLEDAAADARFAADALHGGEVLRARFHAGVPLREEHAGCALGALCVLDHSPRRLDPHHRRALEALGRQAESLLALRCARMREEEHQRIEQRLLQIQRLESLGVLAGGVAHDFSNLLTSMLGKLGLARAGLPSASPAQRHLAGVEAAAHRAAELCRQMLACSGHSASDFENVDLRTLVAASLPLLGLAEGCPVNVSLETAGEPPKVRADAAQIRQILRSIITNALEACEGGTAPPVVWLQIGVAPAAGEAPPAWAFIAVSDNGCGMTAETLARVFDPFFSTKFTGRGLGLAAAQGIARAHQGELQAESELGKGSVFRLLLPCVGDGGTTDTAPAAPGRPAVLIVDHGEGVRGVAASMLEALGFEPLGAGNGPAALECYARSPDAIAAVILDLTLAGMSSGEVLRRLRALRPGAKVLFMSASRDRQAAAALDPGGEIVFLQKPFTLGDLRQGLRVLLPGASLLDAGE